MAFALATLTAAAQTSGASGNASGDDDRIAQLEKEMYRYYSSNAADSFMLITDQLIEACREAGPSQERLFYKAWSNQAIYNFNKVNSTTTPTSTTASSDSTRPHMPWPPCRRAWAITHRPSMSSTRPSTISTASSPTKAPLPLTSGWRKSMSIWRSQRQAVSVELYLHRVQRRPVQ